MPRASVHPCLLMPMTRKHVPAPKSKTLHAVPAGAAEPRSARLRPVRAADPPTTTLHSQLDTDPQAHRLHLRLDTCTDNYSVVTTTRPVQADCCNLRLVLGVTRSRHGARENHTCNHHMATESLLLRTRQMKTGLRALKTQSRQLPQLTLTHGCPISCRWRNPLPEAVGWPTAPNSVGLFRIARRTSSGKDGSEAALKPQRSVASLVRRRRELEAHDAHEAPGPGPGPVPDAPQDPMATAQQQARGGRVAVQGPASALEQLMARDRRRKGGTTGMARSLMRLRRFEVSEAEARSPQLLLR